MSAIGPEFEGFRVLGLGLLLESAIGPEFEGFRVLGLGMRVP